MIAHGQIGQVSTGLPAILRSHAENLPSPDAPDFAAAFDRYADARVVLLGEATHGTHEFYAARARITRHLIARSPADGAVQQLAVYSEGAVLKAADPILVVVPDVGELVVEAQVLNRDAGFVKVGQPVTVKLEAFPFTRYGTLEGKLAWISRDAIQDEKLGPVYAARVTVTPPKRGSAVEVTPGLAASAEIRTDERRVIDYLLSSLERAVTEAGSASTKQRTLLLNGTNQGSTSRGS